MKSYSITEWGAEQSAPRGRSPLLVIFIVAVLIVVFGEQISSAQVNQTTTVQLISANACVAVNSPNQPYNSCGAFSSGAGRIYLPLENLIGAGTHAFTICATSANLQVIAEESPVSPSVSTASFTPVSGVQQTPSGSVNGNPCNTIYFGGVFNYIALNVLANSGGGSIASAQYNGSIGTVPLVPHAQNSTGAAPIPLCDHTQVFTSISPSSNQLLTTFVNGAATYVCGFMLAFSGSTSSALIALIEGSGSTCTSAVTLWSMQITSSSPQMIVVPIPIKAAVNENLCLTVGSVTANTDFNMSYTQF